MKLELDHDRPTGPTAIVFESIVRRFCVAAAYNRAQFVLAPHVIYTRHGDLFVDAVVVDRDGKPPKELKLGVFKFAGLSGLRLTPRRFVPATVFDSRHARYGGVALMMVDPA